MEGKRGMPPSLTPRPWCGSGSDPQHKEGCGGKAKRRSKRQGKRGVRWRKQNWESYRGISRNLIGLVVAWRGRRAHDGGWLSVQASPGTTLLLSNYIILFPLTRESVQTCWRSMMVIKSSSFLPSLVLYGPAHPIRVSLFLAPVDPGTFLQFFLWERRFS